MILTLVFQRIWKRNVRWVVLEKFKKWIILYLQVKDLDRCVHKNNEDPNHVLQNEVSDKCLR